MKCRWPLVGVAVLCLCVAVPAVFAQEAEKSWKTAVSLGYNQQTGNTNKAQFNLGALYTRAWENEEFNAHLNMLYSQSDKKMDSQKWDSGLRYLWKFGQENRWFNSYQITVDHDRFADIDYRITPAAGIGYWIVQETDEKDWKWMVEGSLGYEITNYRSAKPDDEEAVFIGHTYIDKEIFDNSLISEDFYVIPSLEGGGTRFKSVTAFVNPLAENLDLEVKYTIDHDTDPAAGIKKTDTLFTVGIKYTF